jgi:isopenicillin N synthase-like dioxygenase
MSLRDAPWTSAVATLQENNGVAVMDLPAFESIPRLAFEAAHELFPQWQAELSAHISTDVNSAHATGYHGADESNSMSRYNQFRKGMVWSNNETVGSSHHAAIDNLQEYLHEIANSIMTAINQHLQLPVHWLRDHFKYSVSTSQWHLKEYTTITASNSILLPQHTDPSLISIVILHRPRIQPGAMGLQYSHGSSEKSSGGRQWREVSRSGHGCAIVLVGSVLSYISGQYFSACQHRVEWTNQEPRMAATLFLRPHPSCKLVVPPSPLLQHVTLKRVSTFEEWNRRVSKNYQKSKRNKQ